MENIEREREIFLNKLNELEIKIFNFIKVKLNIKRKVDISFYTINNIRKDDKNENLKNISLNLYYHNFFEKDIDILRQYIINYGCEISLNSSNNRDNKTALINKLNKLEKKILGYFNDKLNVKLTEKEVKIDLNNKNIVNNELNLLCSVEFNHLEEINLSHNNISNIAPLKNLTKLKAINLSFNAIENINPLNK